VTGDAGPAGVFDLAGDLPVGTAVLEASAGTGKTYTVSGLAARYLAEGRARVDQLLVVTFGVLATAEVRERTRARLVAAHDGLARPDIAVTAEDPALRALAAGSADDVVVRRRRLRVALAAFDDAAVETTHGFCNRMLTALGLVADAEPDPEVVASADDLVREVVSDFYLRKYAADDEEPPLAPAEAVRVAREAVGVPDALLLPATAPDAPGGGDPAAERVRLAAAVRAEVTRRKRLRRLRDYDDMLTGLRDALDDARHPTTAAAARALLRRRFRVVLVDEFQDTDPVQWDVLRSAFHGHATTVLVGDPKQSIYRFRGADVATYLSAREAAGRVWTLGTNHRSDEAVVGAVRGLLGGVALGDPRITTGPVRARHTGRRLRAADGTAVPALRLRLVPRPPGPRGRDLLPAGRARDLVVADVAADVGRGLGSGLLLADGAGWRPLRPADVAVLVRTNDQARAVHAALTGAGVPATLSGADSVFAGPTAHEWLRLLRALEQPHRTTLVRSAALTCFVGWSADRLAAAVDADRALEGAVERATRRVGDGTTEDGGSGDLDALTERVRGWARLTAHRGVAALVESVTATTDLPARVLRLPGGDRVLTDLRHVGQLLHDEATRHGLGISALVSWLRRRLDEATRDHADDRSLRLESDAAAVQVLTVHRSKGLEWPVVHVPFLWDRWVDASPDPLRLHVDGRRALDVGGPHGEGRAARVRAHRAEDAGEDLRLAYVALTRAACQVVAWWAPTRTTPSSPLHRILFGERDALGGGLPLTVPVPGSDAAVRERVSAVAARVGGPVAVEDAVGGPVPSAVDLPGAAVRPAPARVLDRRLDPLWGRTSYTRLTAAAHDPPPGRPPAEPERALRDDERDPPAGPGDGVTAGPRDDDSALRAVRSPMADLPAGARLGTEVHAVLEGLDPGAVDLAAELRRAAAEAAAGPDTGTGTGVSPDVLAAALLPALRTPLGPTAGGRALADVPVADRLAELDFELPLAGGDAPGPATEAATTAAVATLLRRHLPADDPLAGYPDALDRLVAAGPPRPLRGYLTGSIDALLRVPVPGPTGARYLVVDYKTNRLAPDGETVTAWHYRPEALVTEMVAAHYPLQALLYSVAAHRFLRWRVPGYDPEAHLGGALYLFLRGMCGPDTPVRDGAPTGVLAWRPPAALVLALSDLLHGGPGDR
jgi:exodeoxyribonuclease V beta subunit